MNADLLSAESLRLAADLLLLTGLIGGWAAWVRAGRRQRRLETTLAQAAAELEAATRQLQETARLLEAARATPDASRSNAAESAAAPKRADAKAPANDPDASAAHRLAARRAYAPQSNASRSGAPASASRRAPKAGKTAAPSEAPTGAILRMRREGETPESIARALDIPLGQVRLILKLHTAAPAS